MPELKMVERPVNYHWFQVRKSSSLFAPVVLHGTWYQCQLLMKRECNPRWVMNGVHSKPASLAPDNMKLFSDAYELRKVEIAEQMWKEISEQHMAHRRMGWANWNPPPTRAIQAHPVRKIERTKTTKAAVPYLSVESRHAFELAANDALLITQEQFDEAEAAWRLFCPYGPSVLYKAWALIEARQVPTTLEEYDAMTFLRQYKYGKDKSVNDRARLQDQPHVDQCVDVQVSEGAFHGVDSAPFREEVALDDVHRPF